MVTIQYITPAIGGGAPHTIPLDAPDIETLVTAEIVRLPSALSAHGAGAAPLVHAATVVPVVHAGAAVAQHDTHAHDLVSQGTNAPPTVPWGIDAVPVIAVLQDNGAAAQHTLAAPAATGCQNTLLSAHVPTQPNDHPAADIVAAIDDHAMADVALALADHVGADPVAASGALTKLTTRTFSMANPTLLGDLLILNYLEVGEGVLAS